MKKVTLIFIYSIILLFSYSFAFADLSTEDKFKSIINTILNSRSITKSCNGVQISTEETCNVSYSSILNLNGQPSSSYMPTSQSSGSTGGGSGGNSMLMTMVPNLLTNMLQNALKSVGSDASKSGGTNGGGNPPPYVPASADSAVIGAAPKTDPSTLDPSKLNPTNSGTQTQFSGTCMSGLAKSDSDITSMLPQAGIGNAVSSGYTGLPLDTVLMLRQLKEKCNCNITITSATRVRSNTPQGEHGPGKRTVDLRYDDGLTKFLYANGQKSGCSVIWNGIGFLDEKRCPSGNATGAHWHVRGKGWKCSA